VRVPKSWLLLAIAAVCACQSKPEEAPAAAAATSAAAPTAPAPAPAAEGEQGRLVGRWLRADSDKVIQVSRVGSDGSVDAAYFNPGPIHVSRAAWKRDGAQLMLFVELTDQNYPGNFYALIYDPGSDALSGTYHHLGVNETYEIAFSRLPAGP
jgi:hypothetical protein